MMLGATGVADVTAAWGEATEHLVVLAHTSLGARVVESRTYPNDLGKAFLGVLVTPEASHGRPAPCMLWNTHLSGGNNNKKTPQLQQLLAAVAAHTSPELGVFVLGDLNCVRARLPGMLRAQVKAAADFSCCPLRTCRQRDIDHVLSVGSGVWGLHRPQVLGVDLTSDHNMARVDLCCF